MKLFTAFIIILGLFSFNSAHADGDSCCYCETGTQPESQEPFFVAGCNAWLMKQSGCKIREIVKHGTDYTKLQNFTCGKGNTLKVGYVGHWGSSYESVSYLKYNIVPAMDKYGVSSVVENTACNSMNNPNKVHEFIQNLKLQPEMSLSFKGNQAISVGMWSMVLSNSPNFWALASSNLVAPKYPSCKKYEGYNCLGMVQSGETGDCMTKSGQLKTLTCCVDKNKIPKDFKDPGFTWTEKSNCSSQY